MSRQSSAIRWQPRGVLAALLLLSSVVCLLPSAFGAPPEHADPALAPWFKSLAQPDSGVSCCSLADCRPAEYRQGKEGYEVLIEGEWVPVPPEKILQRIDNPTGRPILCRSGKTIYCFVRPAET